MNPSEKISFYLPERVWPCTVLPESVERDPSIFFLATHLNWVLQTYLRLKAKGHPVRLSRDFPETGIIVTFNGLISFEFKPGPEQFLVSISGDNSAHPFAQMHVVQNRAQTGLLADSFHIPHWPQAGLVPRAAERGNTFNRVVFFGDAQNLAEELRSPAWKRRLAEMGVDWVVRDQNSADNMDYSDVDVVVAARSFQKRGYLRKPASKLYNAWIAGVPAILGEEFAFREERRSEFDYIEATSIEAVFQAICRLKESSALRTQMVENGFNRARAVSVENLTDHWWSLLGDVATQRFETWQTLSESARRRFFLKRNLAKKMRGVRHRMMRLLGREHNTL